MDDLLDVSRITQGKIRVERRRMALREALDTAVESARAACDARSHTLTVSIENAVVRGDLHRLTQVFTNLLGNACKFTPPGGRIDLTATKTDGRVSISVRDTGVGIAPDVLPRIFDLFVQSEASLARSEGGLGLGLPIVKRIVEMHGGNVDAQSQGPGCGATFTVHLPLAPARQGSESAVQLSVLVVEDNLAAAETLQAMLESDGHEVTVAHDGAEGLRLARELLPDVIILDIGLPTMDGYAVAQELRRDPELATATLVAVTGYGTEEHQQRIREAGFAVHMVKPLRYEELKQRVPSLSRSSRQPQR